METSRSSGKLYKIADGSMVVEAYGAKTHYKKGRQRQIDPCIEIELKVDVSLSSWRLDFIEASEHHGASSNNSHLVNDPSVIT